MGVVIYLMQPRKARRIFRHKVPNLCEPGQKFDSFSHQTPTFFSKVSNTLKLLQQPALPKANNTHNYTQTAFRLIRKQTMTLRMKQLSKPKMKERSMSLPQKTNQFSASKKEDKYQSQNPSQLRYSVGEVRKLPERIKKNKVDEIVGSGLAALPLQKILAQRQEYLRVKQKTINLESEEDEQGLIHQKKDTNDELKPDREDFMKWLQKIIGNQGNLYEQYEKGLMEKVNLYERKKNKYKLQFEGSWK